MPVASEKHPGCGGGVIPIGVPGSEQSPFLKTVTVHHPVVSPQSPKRVFPSRSRARNEKLTLALLIAADLTNSKGRNAASEFAHRVADVRVVTLVEGLGRDGVGGGAVVGSREQGELADDDRAGAGAAAGIGDALVQCLDGSCRGAQGEGKNGGKGGGGLHVC